MKPPFFSLQTTRQPGPLHLCECPTYFIVTRHSTYCCHFAFFHSSIQCYSPHTFIYLHVLCIFMFLRQGINKMFSAFFIHLLTAIRLTPGGSSTEHIYTQSNTINLGRVLAVPRLCELYSGICLTTEGKARKNLSQGSRRVAVGHDFTQFHFTNSCIRYGRTRY